MKFHMLTFLISLSVTKQQSQLSNVMTTPVEKSRPSLQKLIIASSFTRFLLSLFCLLGIFSARYATGFQLAWVYYRISKESLGVEANFMVPYYPLENPEFNDPNEGETAVHGCHCLGDMAVRMRKVQAIPHSQVTYT